MKKSCASMYLADPAGVALVAASHLELGADVDDRHDVLGPAELPGSFTPCF